MGHNHRLSTVPVASERTVSYVLDCCQDTLHLGLIRLAP